MTQRLPVFLLACLAATAVLRAATPDFPAELVEFGAPSAAPLIAGSGTNTWDNTIRERGWIMHEDGNWFMWYTGYNYDVSKTKYLGYATSPDGLTWTKWPGNPLTKTGWVEDVCVIKHGGTYYMFAEGKDDIAHLLTSTDRLHWDEKGDLDIRQINGQPITPGPRGTPTAWIENGKWWLFYERSDLAVFAATSTDLKIWTNVSDEPVIPCGPDAYDRYAVAVDQVIKHKGRYYAYYHASALQKWGEWSTCIAVSDDLIQWKKNPQNPILKVNAAMPGAGSGIVVSDGDKYRMYSMHPDVRAYMPIADKANKLAGTHGSTGCKANPTRISRLEITKPGVYENYLVDAHGKGGNTVKITANDVTLRNCEIFNGTGNGVGVFGTRVVLENCRIHHMLNGTFKKQNDAHGITGHWGDVTIRNCDISYVSGDCIQFDPERASSGSVLIEDCHLWTGPLPAASQGFAKGERPGENAVDTKTKGTGDRCKLTLRNCYLHGWQQPAQIANVAALNLKESVDADISNCVFADCEVAMRLRGPGKNGGARITATNCAIYSSTVGLRVEDKLESLKLKDMAYGPDVTSRIEYHNGKELPLFESTGDSTAPAIETRLAPGMTSPQ